LVPQGQYFELERGTRTVNARRLRRRESSTDIIAQQRIHRWPPPQLLQQERTFLMPLRSVRDAGGQGIVAKTPSIEADSIAELRGRQLKLPLRGAIRRELLDSFDEMRRSPHTHEAIDIMAPRNIQVLAVEDGTIAQLFESKAGGTTIY
jgi:murein DD-endopeptidase MepM/ murein hydrolase activator NlpD